MPKYAKAFLLINFCASGDGPTIVAFAALLRRVAKSGETYFPEDDGVDVDEVVDLVVVVLVV
ncbi:MAG TPA: hypothetical protein DCY95_02650, partial [Algoriphagus sp.]|nr:hypothetical protein [Algoriphagus sp.]